MTCCDPGPPSIEVKGLSHDNLRDVRMGVKSEVETGADGAGGSIDITDFAADEKSF
jgi:hypothetical protein